MALSFGCVCVLIHILCVFMLCLIAPPNDAQLSYVAFVLRARAATATLPSILVCALTNCTYEMYSHIYGGH